MIIEQIIKVTCEGCGVCQFYKLGEKIDDVFPHQSRYTKKDRWGHFEKDPSVGEASALYYVSEKRCIADRKISEDEHEAEQKRKDDVVQEIISKCVVNPVLIAISKSTACDDDQAYTPYIEKIVDSVSGSSFVYDMYSRWIDEFHMKCIAAVKKAHEEER